MSMEEMQNTVDAITEKGVQLAMLYYGVHRSKICRRCFGLLKPVGHDKELLCLSRWGKPGCDDPDAKKEV